MEHLLEKCSLYRHYLWVVAFAFLQIQLFSGCAEITPPPPETAPPLKKISSFEYPAFTDDMLFDGLEHCIKRLPKKLKEGLIRNPRKMAEICFSVS